jgi:uncharacterized membrane protein YphA (DoxX/SURF4 family)
MDGPERKAYEKFKEQAQFYRGRAYELEGELRVTGLEAHRAYQRIDRLEQRIEKLKIENTLLKEKLKEVLAREAEVGQPPAKPAVTVKASVPRRRRGELKGTRTVNCIFMIAGELKGMRENTVPIATPNSRSLSCLAARCLHVATGAVLIGAAVLKATQGTAAQEATFPAWLNAPPVLAVAVIAETLLGAALLAGLWPRVVRRVAILVFCVFTIVAAAKWIEHQRSCGCFGRVPVPPLYTAVFDASAVAGLILVRPAPGVDQRGSSRRRVAVAAIVVAGVGGTIAVQAFAHGHASSGVDGQDLGKAGSLVVLEPEKWSGRVFAFAEHIDVGAQLLHGRWVVLLVHNDCDHCARAVPRYLAAMDGDARARLAVIQMPPTDQPPPWQLGPQVLSGRFDTSRDWFASTPVAVLIVDGRVIVARDGDSAARPDRSWWENQRGRS